MGPIAQAHRPARRAKPAALGPFAPAHRPAPRAKPARDGPAAAARVPEPVSTARKFAAESILPPPVGNSREFASTRCRGVANFFGLLAVCSGVLLAGFSLAWVRRRRSLEEDVVSPKDVELRVPATPRGAEVVLATAGARPDLGEVVRRADAQLGLRAEVLAGGPDVLLEGIEDRLGGRAVERMTWSM